MRKHCPLTGNPHQPTTHTSLKSCSEEMVVGFAKDRRREGPQIGAEVCEKTSDIVTEHLRVAKKHYTVTNSVTCSYKPYSFVRILALCFPEQEVGASALVCLNPLGARWAKHERNPCVQTVHLYDRAGFTMVRFSTSIIGTEMGRF